MDAIYSIKSDSNSFLMQINSLKTSCAHIYFLIRWTIQRNNIRQSVVNIHTIHNCLNTSTYELKLLLFMKNFLIIISNYHTHKTHSQYIFTHLDFLFSRSLLQCIMYLCYCEDTIREQKKRWLIAVDTSDECVEVYSQPERFQQ